MSYLPQYDMSIILVSVVIASVVVAKPTVTSGDEVMLRVEAGPAGAIEFGAVAVIVTGLSRARLRHLGLLLTVDSSSNRGIAALLLVNMAHFRSDRDGSSELTCHGR